MKVFSKPSKEMPIAMCGSNKHSHHSIPYMNSEAYTSYETEKKNKVTEVA